MSKDCRFQHFPLFQRSKRASTEQRGLQVRIQNRMNKASCQWPSLSPAGLCKHPLTFSKISSSTDLVLANLLRDLWPGICLTAFSLHWDIPGQEHNEELQKESSSPADKPLNSSALSWNPPLLGLRLPLDKSWEKLNFKFNHFCYKCLNLGTEIPW